MKMIDVFNLIAEGKIGKGTKLKFFDNYLNAKEHKYEYLNKYKGFVNDDYIELDKKFYVNEEFLNFEVELISPKPKKYLIKVNIKGLIKELTVLNYQRLTGKIHLGYPGDTNFVKTSFTKSEMQSIQPVREFLEDMQGKFELIEVEE